MDNLYSKVVFLFCQSFVILVLFLLLLLCCVSIHGVLGMCVHSSFAIITLRKRAMVSSLIVVLLLYGIVGYGKRSKISNICCLAICLDKQCKPRSDYF